MKRIFLYLCLPLVSFVLLASCIKENLDDCERCKLTFSYTGDVDYDIFPQQIKCVSLYVYDQNDGLVTTKRIEQNDLAKYQGTKALKLRAQPLPILRRKRPSPRL